MFVVRYDENKRTFLTKHTDDGCISINILLDEEFEGGGTQFWYGGEPYAHVQPTQAGQVLIHSALLLHEGVPIQKGRRTIFVGFLEVDRVDPFQDQQVMTGLSWWSSWGSLPWLRNRLKLGYNAAYNRLGANEDDWKNNVYIRSFFGTASGWLGIVGDMLLPHFVSNLIADKDREEYFAALDAAYERGEPHGGEANWFAGQQVNEDITGKVTYEWTRRLNHGHRFEEL
jgi:hypothetical protein